jgi:hypothetical protein
LHLILFSSAVSFCYFRSPVRAQASFPAHGSCPASDSVFGFGVLADCPARRMIFFDRSLCPACFGPQPFFLPSRLCWLGMLGVGFWRRHWSAPGRGPFFIDLVCLAARRSAPRALSAPVICFTRALFAAELVLASFNAARFLFVCCKDSLCEQFRSGSILEPPIQRLS